MTISFPSGNTPITPVDPFAPQSATPPSQPSSISLSTTAAPSIISIDASTPRLALTSFYSKVSGALVEQKQQDILAAFQVFQSIRQMFEMLGLVAQFNSFLQSSYLEYDNLQNQLDALDLSGKRDELNDAIHDFNNADPIDALNSAIDEYNDAVNDYKGRFAEYANAVSNLEQAQEQYDTALQAYLDGDIDLDALKDAQDDFEDAKDNFDNSNAVERFLDDQATLIDKKNALEQARNDYNSAELPPETADLQEAIDEWNTAAESAGTIITKMNDLRTLLFPAETALIPPAQAADVTSLPTFNLPSDEDIISNTVVTNVNSYNDLVSNTTNQLIDQVNDSDIHPIGNLSTSFPQGFGTAILDHISISTLPNYTPYDYIDVTSFLDELITALERGTPIVEKAKNIQDNANDPLSKDPLDVASLKYGQANLLGGSGASVAMSTIDSKVAFASPFLESTLSRQAFESILNIYGVPAGSSLVDQLGRFRSDVRSLTGLSSVNASLEILGKADITGVMGSSLTSISALANLSELSRITSSDQFSLAIENFMNTNPELANLTAEQKMALASSLASELSSSLLKEGLSDVATALNMPGLVPQLLALLAGVTTEDGLASFSQQLYEEVLLSQQLSASFGLTPTQAEDVVLKAYADALANIMQPTTDNIKSFILEQLGKIGKSEPDSARKIEEAKAIVTRQIQQEREKNSLIQNKAFKDSLYDELIRFEIDPHKAQNIASQASYADRTALEKTLLTNGLTSAEAQQATSAAVTAYQSRDGNYNPTGTFLAQHLGTNTELAARFKLQVINILSPVVGMKQATQVSEDYGNLIFSSATSVVTRMQINEHNLKNHANYNADARLFEDYRDATVDYRNPQLATNSPMHLGATLLLTGLGGGLSVQGTTSADNVTGPLANRYKHPTMLAG